MSKTLLKIAGYLNLIVGVIAGIFALLGLSQDFFAIISMVILIRIAIKIAVSAFFLNAAYSTDNELYEKRTTVLICTIVSFFVCGWITFIFALIAFLKIPSNGERNSNIQAQQPQNVPYAVKKELTLEEKEERKMKTLLRLGVLLVVLAGIVFATSTWKILSGELKTLVLVFASGMFFGLSHLAEKKLNIRSSAITYYILGNIFIVFAVVATGYFEVFGTWFSLSGAGANLYYAMLSVISGLLFYLASVKYHEHGLLYFVHISSLCVIVFISGFIDMAMSATLLIVAVLACASTFINNEGSSYLTTLKRFGNAILIALPFALFLIVRLDNDNFVLKVISFVLISGTSYYHAIVKNNEIYKVLTPMTTAVTAVALICYGDVSSKVMLLQILLVSTFIYAIGFYKKEDGVLFNVSSVVANIMYLYVVVDSIDKGYNYFAIAAAFVMLWMSIIVTAKNLFGEYHFEKILEPVKVILLSYTIYNLFDSFEIKGNCIFLLVLSIVFLIVFALRRGRMKNVYFFGAAITGVIAYVFNLDGNAALVQLLTFAVIVALFGFSIMLKNEVFNKRKEVLYALTLVAFFTTFSNLIIPFLGMTVTNLIIAVAYLLTIFAVKNNKVMRYTSYGMLTIPCIAFIRGAGFDENIEKILNFTIFLSLIFVYTRGFLGSMSRRDKNVLEGVLLVVWYLRILFVLAPEIALFIGVVSFLSLVAGYKFDNFVSLYYTGIVFLTLNVIIQLRDIWKVVPFWTYMLIAGLGLIGVVTYREYSKKKIHAELANEVIEDRKNEVEPVVFEKRVAWLGTAIYILTILLMNVYYLAI